MFSIIIVNYNLSSNVVESIKSISSTISFTDYEIIIVDNNSSQSEKDILDSELSNNDKIKIYFLESNDGFGAGNNFGFSKSKGDIVFLLNPDTLITKDILSKVKKIFDEYPHLSILGPKITNENDVHEKSAGNFPNLFLEFLNIFSLSILIEKKYFNLKVENAHNSFIDVDWVTGAAMFIRKSAFKKVGGFDTKFFMYSEEVDLCKRIKDKGGRVVYFPEVELIHKGSTGSKKNYYFFTKTSYESKYYYTRKHYFGNKKLLILTFIKINIALQILVWLILLPINPEKSKGKLKAFFELLRTPFISK